MTNMLRPYLTALRIRARLETQYRAAALGGLVTQVFFGLVYIFIYEAFFDGSDPQALKETITYVWLQQLFFRMLLSTDNEINDQIMTGSVAYSLCRPVDQYFYWFSRCLAMKVVGSAMRAVPMIAVQFLLPENLRMSLPDGWSGLGQFVLSLALGALCLSAIENICAAVNMKTLDNRGMSALIRLLMAFLAGNIIPLTLFPEPLQALIRYQPFAQALDAPSRMYLQAQTLSQWMGNLGIQLFWVISLILLGRWMWNRQLRHMTLQGG